MLLQCMMFWWGTIYGHCQPFFFPQPAKYDVQHSLLDLLDVLISRIDAYITHCLVNTLLSLF